MSIFSKDGQGWPVSTISSEMTTLTETWTRLLFFCDSHVDVDVDGTQIYASYETDGLWNQGKNITRFESAMRSYLYFHYVAHCFSADRNTMRALRLCIDEKCHRCTMEDLIFHVELLLSNVLWPEKSKLEEIGE